MIRYDKNLKVVSPTIYVKIKLNDAIMYEQKGEG